MDAATQIMINYGGDGGPFVDALNTALARGSYNGSVLGNAPDGSVDVEFSNAAEAYRFLADTQMADAAVLRDPLRSLADRCVIIISLPLFMYRQAVSGRLGTEA